MAVGAYIERPQKSRDREGAGNEDTGYDAY